MVSQLMQEGTKTCHERDVLAAQLVELEKKYRQSEDQASSFLAGRNCLQVHEFKYLWKMDELSNFTLSTGFHSTITMVKIAACPLIDERDDPLYRCVIAATTGCNTLPSGIPGIGAKRLHALIDEKKPIDANALIDIVISATKRSCYGS
jgi:hypothetical protein